MLSYTQPPYLLEEVRVEYCDVYSNGAFAANFDPHCHAINQKRIHLLRMRQRPPS